MFYELSAHNHFTAHYLITKKELKQILENVYNEPVTCTLKDILTKNGTYVVAGKKDAVSGELRYHVFDLSECCFSEIMGMFDTVEFLVLDLPQDAWKTMSKCN